ncbi:MAG TPA: GNAT family N-acetyltransferase, partial [Actinomycetes bacterium]
YANVFVGSRIHAVGLDSWRLGAEVWGYPASGTLQSLCYAGANLVPVEATSAAVEAFAERAIRQGRRCSSIVGQADAVGALWALLEPHWRSARTIRARQPMMVATRRARPEIWRDERVRQVAVAELDILLPASVAMFTEEIGISPVAGDGGALYRSRVRELIESGRSLARIDGDRVVFKAEIGAVTPRACQVQGVWVEPALRGRGLAVAGMAAVVDHALECVAPAVCLYVNDYNAPARAVYRKVGFEEYGTFMSVLF